MWAQTLPSRANPTGGQVISGSANINTVPGTVSINQATNTAIINWQDFSVATGELTRFQVPTSGSATLNRVTGGNISAIYGTLQSNGQVYLLNPNGILVGASGVIDTAGFVGSTLNFSDAQFNAQGNLNFSGSSTASVINQGTIQASLGSVYLIATRVANSGTIAAPNGTVGMAAGSQVLLQSVGDQHLFVQAASPATSQATGVANTGTIKSATAELRAAGGNAYALAINNSGNIAATGITQINGQVYLTTDGGNITNSGTVSARNANGSGGSIAVNGSGTSPSGNTVLNSGTLNASATVAGGAGGSVTVKNSKGTTANTTSGSILAAGRAGGAGGAIETSGESLQIDGTVSAGQGGSWLLDPSDVTIDNGSGVAPDVNVTTLDNTLNGGTSTTVQAAGGGTDTGNIDVNAAMNWSSSATLTLNAVANVNVNSSITASSGSVNIQAPGAATISSTVLADNLYVNSPSITFNSATVTTYNPNNMTYPSGLDLVDTFGGVGQVNITGSTVTGSTMQIGVYYNFTSPVFCSQVSINNSAINLTLGANPPTSNLSLEIYGASTTPGAAGVSITNGSSITAVGTGVVAGTSDDYVNIDGQGLVAAGQKAIGVLVSGSTLANGSSGAPGDANFYIEGDSDSGSVAAAPATFGAASAYGVEITNGSTISNYSPNGFGIHGYAFADDDAVAVGLLIDGASTVQDVSSHMSLKGDVAAENLTGGGEIGAAYGVVGVGLDDATLTESEIGTQKSSGLSIQGGVDAQNVVATANGNTSIAASDYGIDIIDTQLTATGDTQILTSPISMMGEAGAAVSTLSQVGTSVGVSISGGATISNSGYGVISVVGASDLVSGSPTTGANVVADGVEIMGTSGTPETISATGGGSIALAGMGGVVGSGSTGSAIGVNLQYANVTTNSGIIILFAGAGSGLPAANLIGLNLGHANVGTGTTGGTTIPNSTTTVPPLIMIYATDSSAYKNSSSLLTFQLGPSTGFAIDEDANSSLVTPNLVMGDYYNLFTAYLPANVVASLPTFSAFNSFLNGTSSLATTISSQGVVINPAGAIDLSSTLNQVTNLDSALDGSGGFDLYDSVNLTIDPIGGSNNQNYGQIDEAGLGPVLITVAPNQNLTLTDVSPFPGIATSSLPVIATGSGSSITLVTSGTGVFTNEGGATALSPGSEYIIYANQPSQAVLDGLTPASTLYSTAYPGASGATANTIAYATGSFDVLTGVAYTDTGGTIGASGVTIDLISGGVQIGTTTAATSGTVGAFSFDLTPADLTGGILLTDPADNGNTYYQTASPASVSGIDIFGDTLRVMASTVSNAALKAVAGSLAVNYAVTGSNLTTNAGINISILPTTAYTLDGSITAGGNTANATLTTGANSTLSATAANVTLAGSTITVGSSLTSAGTVNFNSAGTIIDTGSVQVGNFILQGGTWTQIVGQNGLAALPAFNVTSNFSLGSGSTFERFAGGNGSGTPYEITDIFGLQGLASPSGNLLGVNANLVNDISATGTSAWNSGAGFVPIGNSTTAYTGTFDGQNFTINGLYINQPSGVDLGLFGATGGALIENLGLTNVNLNGENQVGGLVGYNMSDTISHVYSTGSVNGVQNVGGLVGSNDGTINIAYSTGAVTASPASTNVGGLVGNNGGSINNAFSAATVTAAAGSSNMGGFVGLNNVGGTISDTYSTGIVDRVAPSTDAGAFVGDNLGTMNNSFYDTNTAGTTPGVGSNPTSTTTGVSGATEAELETQSYVAANTSPSWDFVNTWTTYGGSNTAQLIALPEVHLSVPIIFFLPPIYTQPAPVSLANIDPIQQPGDGANSKAAGRVIVNGGVSGVASSEDQKADRALARKLAQKYGAARAERMLEIIKQDLKDGSTVNTDTLVEKWVANTGLSKLVTVDGTAQLSDGLALPLGNDSLIFGAPGTGITPETLETLSRAAFGHAPAPSH